MLHNWPVTGVQRMRDAVRSEDDSMSVRTTCEDLEPEPAPFTDDEEEERLYAEDPPPPTLLDCPVCDVTNSMSGSANEHIQKILRLEEAGFGALPDVRVFEDIAQAFNREILVTNARLGKHLSKWTKRTVRQHFDRCRIVPRRRAAKILRRADLLLTAVFNNCRQRDAQSGRPVLDVKHLNTFFTQAKSYMTMLRDYRALAGVNGSGAADAGAPAAVVSTQGAASAAAAAETETSTAATAAAAANGSLMRFFSPVTRT